MPVIVVERLEEAPTHLQESDHKNSTKQEAHRKHSKKFWVKLPKHSSQMQGTHALAS
jgi:hypothetical protein